MQIRLALITLLLLLGTVAPAPAQESSATVRLDGRTLFRVSVAEGEAQERALEIERRLEAVLENPRALGPARVRNTGEPDGSRVITVAGRPVVTITPLDAELTGVPVPELAVQWAQAVDRALERAAERRLSRGGRFTAEIQGSLQNAFARVTESAITVVPRALSALLVIALFWILAGAVRWLTRVITCRFVHDATIENLVKQIAFYSIWLLGIIVAANAYGVEPQTAITGLGLTSLALGFALKDILSNFVSGLLLLTLRPFRIGDQIVIGETEGTVERIELRATQMRTYDGRQILVPNAELFTSRVTNNTAAPIRRSAVQLHLGYDADLARVIAVLKEALNKVEGVLRDPPTTILVDALGTAQICIEARFWTDSRRSDFLATTSLAHQTLLASLKEEGIALPGPATQIVVPGQPERWRKVLHDRDPEQ